ncbi:MAG: hypothetical protein ACHQQQ_03530 [Bacteroidota bacterium]
MAKEITQEQYFVLRTIQRFEYLMRGYKYNISSIIFKVQAETSVGFESIECRRFLSIQVMDGRFYISIYKMKRPHYYSDGVTNYDSIRSEDRNGIIKEIQKLERDNNFEQLIQLYGDYIESNLGEIIRGEAWFK